MVDMTREQKDIASGMFIVVVMPLLGWLVAYAFG